MKRIFTFIVFLLFGMAATLMAASEIHSIYPEDAISVADGMTVDLFDVSAPGVTATSTAERHGLEQYAFESDQRIINLGTGAGTMVVLGVIVRNRDSDLWRNTTLTWPRYLLTDSELTQSNYTWLPGNLLAGSISTRD